jgi:predicted dehydrogenase
MEMFPKVPRFQDFRRMFDMMSKGIDAVSVAVPDFSHFPIAMLAMSFGKHVYCEKPMAQSFRQVELMMEAEKKYKVVAQMGNQGHQRRTTSNSRHGWTPASSRTSPKLPLI